MLIFISELVGTALLILLGCGVVANVVLEKSAMKGGGTVQITFGWGLAVLLPAFIFGKSSGAHLNPAITLAFAADGQTPWGSVPYYLSGQLLGAFIGGVLVYILFKGHLDAEENKDSKLGVFATRPSVPNTAFNFLSELVGTFVLVFAIMGIGNVDGLGGGIDKFFVFAIIVSIGMSLGGLTGYAINPARDLGPRLAHALMPIKGKRDSNWKYAWIPIAAPIVGAYLAVALYRWIPWNS